MNKAHVLTLAFIDYKPAAAARALNTLSADDAAAFLDKIPVKPAEMILARIGAWSASRIMSRMAVDQAASVMQKLPYMEAAAILRMMRVEPRDKLLAVLPRRLMRDFEGSLAFPESTVGGQMTTDFIALEAHHTIGDAADALRKAAEFETDVIFVTDDRRHYVGALPLTALFRYSRSALIESVIDQEVQPLSARQQLNSVVALPGWNRVSSLPVVSRNHHLIGSLSVRQLHAATSAPERVPRRARMAGMMQSLVEEYFSCAAELTRFIGHEDDARGADKPRRRPR